jgi:formamidopyrimidine-DNA glycosylase
MPEEERLASGRWGYVYLRGKKPCLRCGTAVEMVRQGERGRMTFFCPRCQPEVGADS